jgi:hypothetical protein
VSIFILDSLKLTLTFKISGANRELHVPPRKKAFIKIDIDIKIKVELTDSCMSHLERRP